MTEHQPSFQLNGNSQVIPMLGDPIGQVKAPSGLTPVLQRRGLNALVVPWHVKAEGLSLALTALASVGNVPGAVLTLPHKLAARQLCTEISPRAGLIGAVNVLRKLENGRWYGDHTDGVGYLNGLRKRGFQVMNSRALVIGAGGAGSAIAWELLAQGAQEVAVYDVDRERTRALIDRLSDVFPDKVILGDRSAGGYDLLANASSAGMTPDDPHPVELECISPWQFLAEAITQPPLTAFLEQGRKLGCGIMTGNDMFEGQVEALADLLFPESNVTPTSNGEGARYANHS